MGDRPSLEGFTLSDPEKSSSVLFIFQDLPSNISENGSLGI